MAGSFGFWNTKETYKPILDSSRNNKREVERNDYDKFLYSMKLYHNIVKKLYTSELMFAERQYIKKCGKKETINEFYKKIKLKIDGEIRQI